DRRFLRRAVVGDGTGGEDNSRVLLSSDKCNGGNTWEQRRHRYSRRRILWRGRRAVWQGCDGRIGRRIVGRVPVESGGCSVRDGDDCMRQLVFRDTARETGGRLWINRIGQGGCRWAGCDVPFA